MDSDSELMRCFARGDNAAFDLLVLRHTHWAVRFCYRYIRDRSLAEEVAQDAFVKLFLSRENYKPMSSFRAFFSTILRNTITDNWRKSGRRPIEMPIDTVADKALSQDSPEEQFLLREADEELWLALKQLPADQRLVLTLKEYGSLSYQEISKATGLTLANVKVLIHRARKALQKQFRGREQAE